MGYIGEYIHYRTQTYKDFGINRTNGSNNWSSAYTNQRQHLQNLTDNNNGDDQRCAALSQWYTELYYGDTLKTPLSLDSSDSAIQDMLYQTVADIINETSDNSINMGSHGWTADDVRRSFSKPNNALIQNTGFTGAKIGNKIALTTLDKALDGLKTAYKRAIEVPAHQGLGRNTISLRDAELTVEQLQKQILALEASIYQVQKSIQGSSPNKKVVSNLSQWNTNFKKGVLKNSGINVPNFKDVLLYVQDVLRLYQGDGVYKIAGPASEVGAIVKMVYENALKNEVYTTIDNKLLKQLVKKEMGNAWQGYQHQSLIYTNKLSFDMVDENSLLSSWQGYQKTGDGFSVMYDASGGKPQGTIDVSLTPDLDTELWKIINTGNNALRTINVSQKNYSNIKKSGVHLVQQTPLVSLLLTNYFLSDFGNHYLNLIGTSPYSNSANLKEATNIIYWGGALRGLMGINQENQFLVINDKTTKQVYVTTANIFNRMLEMNYSNINKIIKVDLDHAENLDGNRINQFENIHNGFNWIDAQKRITKLLIDVNKAKLTISLRGNTALTL